MKTKRKFTLVDAMFLCGMAILLAFNYGLVRNGEKSQAKTNESLPDISSFTNGAIADPTPQQAVPLIESQMAANPDDVEEIRSGVVVGVALRFLFYDLTETGGVTNVWYIAERSDGHVAAFREATGKAEPVGGTELTPKTDTEISGWTDIFLALKKDGKIPQLPLRFVEGEYEVRHIDSEAFMVELNRKTEEGFFSRNARVPLTAFGSRPYYNQIFRFAELTCAGEKKFYPVSVADPIQGRHDHRVSLSLR